MMSRVGRVPKVDTLVPELLVTVEGDEIKHSGALAIPQNYKGYTEENQAVWRELFQKQWENLQDIAFPTWLDAIDKIGVTGAYIPKLTDIQSKLMSFTGWQPVPISGFLDASDYFTYLANRQFPTVVNVRKREEMEFIALPDIFHDAFGHLPMHSHPVFADFLQLFGRTALRATTEQQLVEMQRLYWWTVEYCLIRVNGKLKVCGSGHMSGIQESRHSLTDAVEKRPFSLEAVINQEFNPHELQPIMFVIDDYEQLFDAMAAKAKEFGCSLYES